MGSILGPVSGVHISAILLLVLGALILAVLLILYGRKERRPRIRQLPAFQDLQKEMGRAAESGKPFHIALGSGGLDGEDAVTSLAALQVVDALVDTAVSYNVPPIITIGDPTLLPLAQDILRRAYERQQSMELYDPGQVRFIAPSSLSYAVQAGSTTAMEDLTANVMVGSFGAEVSLIADAGASRDLPQLAAAADPRAVSALYPATERLAVGEELYAAGARMTGEGRYVAGLVAEDILRIVLILAILGAAVSAFLSV